MVRVDVTLLVERLALRMGVRARWMGGRARLDRARGEKGGGQHSSPRRQKLERAVLVPLWKHVRKVENRMLLRIE